MMNDVISPSAPPLNLVQAEQYPDSVDQSNAVLHIMNVLDSVSKAPIVIHHNQSKQFQEMDFRFFISIAVLGSVLIAERLLLF